jgi:SAM-dependent methyltransferase
MLEKGERFRQRTKLINEWHERGPLKKVYQAHEAEYCRMKSRGVMSWRQRAYSEAIDPSELMFFEDVCSQDWAPTTGKAIELGCGTGAFSRYLCDRGYSVTGVDISPTAISMAKEQKDGRHIKYLVQDICTMDTPPHAIHELCVDGHFLHCLTSESDRHYAFKRIKRLLVNNGIFILMSMCAPISDEHLSRLYKDQILIDDVLYVPQKGRSKFKNSRKIKEKVYNPARYVCHWHGLMDELQKYKLSPMLVRYIRWTEEEPISFIHVAAVSE